jgi:hypothetical protein
MTAVPCIIQIRIFKMQKRSNAQGWALLVMMVVIVGSFMWLPSVQMGPSTVYAQFKPSETPDPCATPIDDPVGSAAAADDPCNPPGFGPDPGPIDPNSGVDANGNPVGNAVFPGKGTIFVGSTKVVVDVFARQLPPFYVGSQSVIDIPYLRGVDIFAYYKGNVVQQFFADPITVCLRGEGVLLFAAASQRPRVFLPIDLAPSRYKGFTCAYIGQPGTLALVKK